MNKYNTWLINFGPSLHAPKHSALPLGHIKPQSLPVLPVLELEEISNRRKFLEANAGNMAFFVNKISNRPIIQNHQNELPPQADSKMSLKSFLWCGAFSRCLTERSKEDDN